MTDAFDPTVATAAVEEVDVDFSGTSDDFAQLDDGWYLFVLETATARTDEGGVLLSQKGAPMIKWISKVVQAADGKTDRAGAPMYQYTVTSGAGAFSLRRFVNRAFGLNLGKEPMKLQLGPFIGKKYWGQVGPQKNDASFKEFKDFRPENQPPSAAGNGNVPAGIGNKI